VGFFAKRFVIQNMWLNIIAMVIGYIVLGLGAIILIMIFVGIAWMILERKDKPKPEDMEIIDHTKEIKEVKDATEEFKE